MAGHGGAHVPQSCIASTRFHPHMPGRHGTTSSIGKDFDALTDSSLLGFLWAPRLCCRALLQSLVQINKGHFQSHRYRRDSGLFLSVNSGTGQSIIERLLSARDPGRVFAKRLPVLSLSMRLAPMP